MIWYTIRSGRYGSRLYRQNTMKNRRLFGLVVALFSIMVLAASGCQSNQAKSEATEKRQYSFWPPTPDEPRIQFLRAINSSADVTPPQSHMDEVMYGKEQVLAIVKPWSWWAGPSRSAVARAAPSPTTPGPSPTPDLSPAGLAAETCLGTGAWRIATLETWRLTGPAGSKTQEVRVWLALSPTVATDAEDPSIPLVNVAAMEVDALGWCAPVTGPDAPAGPMVVNAFRLDGAGAPATEIGLRRIAPTGGVTPFAALYQDLKDCGPPSGSSCTSSGPRLRGATWPAGQYLFRLQDVGASHVLWFRVLVIDVPAPVGSPGSSR